MLTETVTVERPAGVDRYGDPLTPVSRQLAGCVFAPRGGGGGTSWSVENPARGDVMTPNTIVSGLAMYAPSGANLDATDVIVRADGTRWQVLGMPGVWQSPFSGWTPGVEVSLGRVEG